MFEDEGGNESVRTDVTTSRPQHEGSLARLGSIISFYRGHYDVLFVILFVGTSTRWGSQRGRLGVYDCNYRCRLL
jgi:hypothetical protein